MIIVNDIVKSLKDKYNIKSNGLKIIIPKHDKYGYVSIHSHSIINDIGITVDEFINTIKEKINYIENIECVNDYCNIYICEEQYERNFFEVFDESYILSSINVGNNNKVILEHTSSTPDSSPHLGRSRGTIIGDSLKRLFLLCGYNVCVEYFVNDLAKQVSMLAYCLECDHKYNLSEISYNYQKMYEICKNDKKINDIVDYQICERQNGNLEYINKFNFIVNNCLEEQQQIFDSFQVFFDNYIFESKIVENNCESLLKKLNDMKLLTIDEYDRICVPMYKNDIFSKNIVLTRSNGSSLYSLRDLCYLFYKSTDDLCKNIIVLPKYQEEHMNEISYILDCMHINLPKLVYYDDTYNYTVKMSTKKNTGVLLEKLINRSYLFFNDFEYDFSTEEKQYIVNKSIRMYVLKEKASSKLVYSYEKFKKLCYNEIKKFILIQYIKNASEFYGSQSIDFSLLKQMDMIDDYIIDSVSSLQVQNLLKYQEKLDRLFFDNYKKVKNNRVLISKYMMISKILDRALFIEPIERRNAIYEDCAVYSDKIKQRKTSE